MNVKRVAVAGVIVERRCELNVNIVREGDPCADLPREQKRVRIGDQLGPADSSDLTGCGGAPTERIFRVRIVVNELRKIHEDVDLELERFRRWRDNNSFAAFFAVA